MKQAFVKISVPGAYVLDTKEKLIESGITEVYMMHEQPRLMAAVYGEDFLVVKIKSEKIREIEHVEDIKVYTVFPCDD